MGKILEKSVKTVREAQRDSCNRSFAFGELGIDRTRNRNVRVSFFEIPAANIGRIGNGRPDAQGSAPAGLDAISAGHEFDFARAERVVDMKAHFCALLAPLGDSQFLGGGTQDRQVRGRLDAKLDLRVRAGTFHIVGDGYADLKFVAGGGQHRRARRNDKRPANERVTFG